MFPGKSNLMFHNSYVIAWIANLTWFSALPGWRKTAQVKYYLNIISKRILAKALLRINELWTYPDRAILHFLAMVAFFINKEV